MRYLFFIAFLTCGISVQAQNVGVGTSAPAGRLHVSYESQYKNPGILLTDSTLQRMGILQFQNVDNGKYIRADGRSLSKNSSDSYLDIRSDSVLIATFRGNGMLGVGNVSPNESLDVAGNINLTGNIKVNGTSGSPGQALMMNSSGNMVWASMASSYSYFWAFKTAGNTNWTVPAGVTKILIEAWGAGGGGRGDNITVGNGGGGGGYVIAIANVTPGDVLPITIGTGGTGGSSNTSGTTTSVGIGASTVQAFGGVAASSGSTGGTWSIVLPGTTIVSYDGEDGEPGELMGNEVFQRPAVGDDLAHYKYGNGGNCANTTATGGVGGTSTVNATTASIIFGANSIKPPRKPGGGGCATYSPSASIYNTGASGKVVIHW
ncbi:MAG TPA: hypothetical protein VLC98_00845 [Phnomibacter sp.]|nr:hypothetical protein [Phnomibacter sp.]